MDDTASRRRSAIGDLAADDYVTVNVRADRGASLDDDQGHGRPGIVGDHGQTLTKPNQPLYLFRGTFVSAGGGKVTIDVKGGNRRALRLMIGQAATQTFTIGRRDGVPPLGAPDPDRDRRRRS